MFHRDQRSLFGEILDWMLTPLLLLWPISLALTWLVAQEIANKPFDRALVYNAQALAQLLHVGPSARIQFNLPQPASELLRADDSDQVHYQVLGPRGDYLSGERNLPAPTDNLDLVKPGEVLLRDDEFRGTDVRIAYVWIRLGPGTARPALVQVAETREKRKVLATEIIKGVMLPQFVILPLAVFPAGRALVRGIPPLSSLEARSRPRRSDDLSPLDTRSVPLEVAPLVNSVNGLLQRLKDSIQTQKRFLADAAHQLKTPLAGLRMQADLALREGASKEELAHTLRQIEHSSVRATHTVNQLLALARAESGGTSIQTQPYDLAALTMDVVRDTVPRALEKGHDLGYEGVEPGAPGVMMRGNPVLLQEMVRNLVNNALNYTPTSPQAPGVVTVRVLADPYGQILLLQVEDNGPGIPAAEVELVFRPFYRSLGTNVDGSGLGLPIVSEIARQHQGAVEVEETFPGKTLPGARFQVRFQSLPIVDA